MQPGVWSRFQAVYNNTPMTAISLSPHLIFPQLMYNTLRTDFPLLDLSLQWLIYPSPRPLQLPFKITTLCCTHP